MLDALQETLDALEVKYLMIFNGVLCFLAAVVSVEKERKQGVGDVGIGRTLVFLIHSYFVSVSASVSVLISIFTFLTVF